jgi:hypothetical protein
MGSQFMQQFMQGWQMGQSRNENQRRNQELAMEQKRQQELLQQRAQEFEMRKEEFAVQKKMLAAQEAEHAWKAKQEAAAMMSRNQQTLPPETQDLGGGTTLNLGPATQPRDPITAAIPGAPEGTPEVPMMFREDIEDQKRQQLALELERLGVATDITEGIKAQYREKPKGLDEIFAEAKARAAGGRAGAPPVASTPPEPGEMNPKQRSTFLTITNKFQADKIMEKAGNALQADQLADEAIRDPGKATNQLATLYLLVKNLDPDSAVREGELGLAQATQSYWQKFQTSWARVSSGQIISPEAAKELALATKMLSKQWADRGAKRVQQYKAQASGAGIGANFDDYLAEAGIGAPADTGGEWQTVAGVKVRKKGR